MKVVDLPITDAQIMNVFNKGNFPDLNMIGVGLRDEILDKKVRDHINRRKDNAIIINLDTTDQPGSHWVAVYKKRGDRKAYYFDSFGMAPFPEVLYFIKNILKAKTFHSMDMDLQEEESSLCGYYAIAWILSKYFDMPFRSVFKPQDFDGNLDKLTKLFKDL